MLDASCFNPKTFEERSIVMADGSTAVLFFRHLSNSDFERYAIWRNSADEAVVAAGPSRLLALGLCEPDGSPSLTIEQAESLKRPVALQLMAALFDVNGYGKKDTEKPGNVSTPGTIDGSGT